MKKNYENMLAAAQDIGNYFGTFFVRKADNGCERYYIDNEDKCYVYSSLEDLLIDWLGTLEESDDEAGWGEYIFFIREELMGEKIKDDFFRHYLDVYNLTYTYDEMKILDILSRQCERMPSMISLTYEDMALMAHDVYKLWDENQTCECFEEFPWMEIANSEEEGYAQAFAARIAEDIINLYYKEKQRKGY